MKLRPYQEDVQQRVFDEWDKGVKRVMAVLPTGAGKTHIKSSITSILGVPTMAIAHRQELILQISESLATFGIQHRVIAPNAVIRFCNQRHVRLFGQSFTHGNDVMVASVQTLVRRQDKLKHLFGRIKLVDIDECFPSGTLVDGKRIENLRVGDMVTAFDEATGRYEMKPIISVMKNPMPQDMVRLHYGTHHVLTCTPGHPIWTKRGWVRAGELINDDEVLHVWSACESQSGGDGGLQKDGSSILQQNVRGQISHTNVVGDDGGNQSQICVGADEEEESDAQRRIPFEDDRDTQTHRAPTIGEGRERMPSHGSGSAPLLHVGSAGVRIGTECSDGSKGAGFTMPLVLQNRLRTQDIENSNRGGRRESQQSDAARVGLTQGYVSDWKRVDGISFHQRSNLDGWCDSYVYNIGVADLHTYVADGVVVHNCHHVLPDNQWGQAMDLFPNARGLGVTATPLRCDGKPLSGCWDTMVVGPTMRELISMGFLADYRIFCPPVSINTDQIRISKSSGEYVKADLIDASHESSIVGDVVSHYLRVAGGKRGLTFATDLASARRITDAYVAAGVPALYVDGNTPDKERIEASDKLRRGEVLQLVNVDLFGEGYDVPSVEVVSMARPTQSYGLYCQMFGRALRPSQGKPHAIILDHVGNIVRHGLPDRAVVWSLDGKRKRDAAVSDEIPLTVCAACLQPRERIYKSCPYCGHVNEPASRASPIEVDGDLMELDPAVLAAMRGDVVNVESGQPAIPYGASGAIVGRKIRDWGELCDAQTALRASISHWAGVWKYGSDHDDSMLHRRFYLTFGIDVLGAMALRRADAVKLDAKIQGSLV